MHTKKKNIHIDVCCIKTSIWSNI